MKERRGGGKRPVRRKREEGRGKEKGQGKKGEEEAEKKST